MQVLKVTGADAKDFLERQASSNKDYVAFLTPKAKVIALAFWQEPYLICQDGDALMKHLERFVIVEDVEFAMNCNAPAELAMTPSFEACSQEDTLIKLENTYPGILDKYVDFNKGCFPGQEPLSKFKNIGMKKRQERSQGYLDEALDIFAKAASHNELGPAIELLTKAIKDNPKNEDAYESLGVMLAKQEQYQEAIKVMHQLELMNPKNQMAQMNLSIFYMKIGDKETAEEHKAKGTVLAFDEALKSS